MYKSLFNYRKLCLLAKFRIKFIFAKFPQNKNKQFDKQHVQTFRHLLIIIICSYLSTANFFCFVLETTSHSEELKKPCAEGLQEKRRWSLKWKWCFNGLQIKCTGTHTQNTNSHKQTHTLN